MLMLSRRRLTVVAGSGHVLDLQSPGAGRVLVPGVGGHERPVVEAFGRVVVRPAAQTKAPQTPYLELD